MAVERLPAGGLDYSVIAQRISGLAIAALMLGILALAGGVMVIGFPLGIVALLSGKAAVRQIDEDPARFRGRGLARAGIYMGIVGLLLAPMVTIFVMLQARDVVNRGECAANLRGIGQAMQVYASENGDRFPLVPFAPYGSGNGGTSRATVPGPTAKEANAGLYGPTGPVNGSPLAGLWILCERGDVPARMFLCPSDPAISRATFSSLTAPGGSFYASFQADKEISYSVAYPYDGKGDAGGWWKNTGDSGLPLLADMNPLSGTGRPKRDPSVASSGSHAAKLRNSANHQGIGQNIAYGDGHTEFVRTPEAGQGGDNIYTVGGAAGGSATGTAVKLGPLAPGGAAGSWDTIMVPARDLDTGKLW